MDEWQQWLKPRKSVDVVIYSEDEEFAYVQFEVKSNKSYVETRCKLAYGLMSQVQYLMNRDIDCSVVGFCVPVETGYMEKVVCEWSNEDLITSVRLQHGHVLLEVTAAFEEQSKYSTAGLYSNGYSIPMSKQLLEGSLVMVHTMKSRNSVVICDHLKVVYKAALNSLDKNNLLYLFELGKSTTLRYSALPIQLEMIKRCPYLIYSLYLLPLSRKSAYPMLRLIVGDVAEALQQLHDNLNLAHMDVRLENMCFRKDGHAILIDLDRSIVK